MNHKPVKGRMDHIWTEVETNPDFRAEAPAEKQVLLKEEMER